jgi:hypothetical protein
VITQFHRERNRLKQALGVLCVFLVVFVATVQATHVHPESARHDCSICSIAHAGALASGAFQATPIFRPAVLETAPVALVVSLQPTRTQFIRPPPSV